MVNEDDREKQLELAEAWGRMRALRSMIEKLSGPMDRYVADARKVHPDAGTTCSNMREMVVEHLTDDLLRVEARVVLLGGKLA